MPFRTRSGAALAPCFPTPQRLQFSQYDHISQLETKLEVEPTTDEIKLNKTERAWLEVIRGRSYREIFIQSWTWKLGDNCRYTPDFVVLDGGQLVAFETKGFMRDDALVKLKVAARMLRFVRFVVVKREGNQWIETQVKP